MRKTEAPGKPHKAPAAESPESGGPGLERAGRQRRSVRGLGNDQGEPRKRSGSVWALSACLGTAHLQQQPREERHLRECFIKSMTLPLSGCETAAGKVVSARCLSLLSCEMGSRTAPRGGVSVFRCRAGHGVCAEVGKDRRARAEAGQPRVRLEAGFLKGNFAGGALSVSAAIAFAANPGVAEGNVPCRHGCS